LLRIENLNTYYGLARALKDISLEVEAESIVCIIGANGAGKSTLLKTISGIVHPSSGSIKFLDNNITREKPSQIVRIGISQVPEGRRLFGNLSVHENLILGAYLRFKHKNDRMINRDFDFVYNMFPRLGEMKKRLAGSLSGGEQQMLAIGRGLMSRPKLLLLDEPSIGLAPLLVQEIFKVIRDLKKEGITVMLVEQNARLALSTSDYGYVLELGEVILKGKTGSLFENEVIKRAYLGK
jgi:branched-chain amino acid transport system ATP-binding protein